MTAGERLQRCANCDGLTGKTTEDAIFLGEYGPLCEECADRLVASAPEMLEVLEDLVDILEKAARSEMDDEGMVLVSYNVVYFALSKAHDVIRKARGE